MRASSTTLSCPMMILETSVRAAEIVEASFSSDGFMIKNSAALERTYDGIVGGQRRGVGLLREGRPSGAFNVTRPRRARPFIDAGLLEFVQGNGPAEQRL